MGLFDFFKKPPTIHDDFFGTLTLISFKDPTKNYFEGRGEFNPTGEEIDFSVEADLDSPTKEQKEFYNQIQSSYDEIILRISPLIVEEMAKWNIDIEFKKFNIEFKLVGLSIPSFKSLPLIWDMSFETIHDLNHQVTVEFKDFEPSEIIVDG